MKETLKQYWALRYQRDLLDGMTTVDSRELATLSTEIAKARHRISGAELEIVDFLLASGLGIKDGVIVGNILGSATPGDLLDMEAEGIPLPKRERMPPFKTRVRLTAEKIFLQSCPEQHTGTPDLDRRVDALTTDCFKLSLAFHTALDGLFATLCDKVKVPEAVFRGATPVTLDTLPTACPRKNYEQCPDANTNPR